MARRGGKPAAHDEGAPAPARAPFTDASPAGVRRELLGRLKSALAAGRAEIDARLRGGASGAALVAATSRLVDGLVREALDVAAACVYPRANPTEADRLAVLALGGYGRAELAPYSDIDLLFLHPYKRTPWCEQIAEFVLYLLWDLGFQVGHAVRSIDDTLRLARADMTIRTSLIEARHIWGEKHLSVALEHRFGEEIVAGTAAEFIAAKLEERDRRHQRMGDSRYVLEPNIKEGKGGLRDLHTLFWIAKYIYRVERFRALVGRGVITGDEYRRFARAEDFFWRVRAHLHALSGRAEERLTFDVQPEIARRMGYRAGAANAAVMRFMKHYFKTAKTVGDLTRVLCAELEAEHLRRPPGPRTTPALAAEDARAFGFRDGRIAFKRKEAIAREPAHIVRLFRLAQKLGCDIHPSALRRVMEDGRALAPRLRQSAEAARQFAAILGDPSGLEVTLRRLNEAGVLGWFLPAFGRIVGQAQHDMYHVYTVDEHTIRALGVLAALDRGRLADELPLASAAIRKTVSTRPLYLALLLHDVAKGQGGGHSEKGARRVARIAQQLGFSREEAETAAWLVRHHLAFADTAFKRDVNDPQTVADFVQLVQSVERLRLLLAMTVADIRAVGPGRWNAWRGALLRTLYARAEETLSGGHEALESERRVAVAQRELARRLEGSSARALKAHAARLPDAYWLAFDVATHARHAAFLARARGREKHCSLDIAVDPRRGVSEIAFHAPDQPGLVATIAGALALNGASVVDAKIFTTADGMAFDVFSVQDAEGGAFDDPRRHRRLEADIEAILAYRLDLEAALAERRRVRRPRAGVFRVEPRVLIDNKASRHHTRIEVNGNDRPGLLHDLTLGLSRLGLSIASAQIATYGPRAVDAFYVSGPGQRRIRKPERLAAISAALLAILADGAAAPRRT